MQCEAPRGTLYNAEKGQFLPCPCGRWSCPGCARFKGQKIAERLESLAPDFFITLDLDRHAWAIPENAAELQRKMRILLRWMDRQAWLRGYAWVNESGAKAMLCTVCNRLRRSKRDSRKDGCTCAAPVLSEACICARERLLGCICGAYGENLHRHLALRVGDGARNRYGMPFFPWDRLHEAARRIGLVVSDVRLVLSHGGLGQYMAKFARYLAKSFDSPLHNGGHLRVVDRKLRQWTEKSGITARKVRQVWDDVVRFIPNHARRYGFSQGVPPAPKAEGWTYFPLSVFDTVLLKQGLAAALALANPLTGEVPAQFAASP